MSGISRGRHKKPKYLSCSAYHAGRTTGHILDVRQISLEIQNILDVQHIMSEGHQITILDAQQMTRSEQQANILDVRRTTL